jgi:glycosyltransferase involved in cell wall biosynthesis
MNPPHVLVIVQNMPVPLDRRVWLECRSLADAGWSVSVICPRGDRDAAFDEIEGVRIHRYRPARAVRGVVGYGWEFLYSWVRTALLAVRIACRGRIDIVQACNPPDTYWLLAWLLRPFGTRFVFDHHDLCPELYESRGLRRSAVVASILRWLEGQSYRHADLVITTNGSYRAVTAARTGVAAEAIEVVVSGPDPSQMARTEPRPELRRGRNHLCAYLGLMGPQDGVDLVVRAAAVAVYELQRTDCQFALLGYGDCLHEIQRLATDLGVAEYVTFTGRADAQMIEEYLSTADVGVTPDPKTAFTDVSTMNKVLEYMAYEVPVVSFDLREVERSAGSAAVLVEWSGVPDDDIHRFAEAVVHLLDDPVARRAMGKAGRARIEDELGWPQQQPVYVAAYERLLSTRSRGANVRDRPVRD